MAVDVHIGATFEHGPPRVLFDTRVAGTLFRYDVSPDGRRFLINTVVNEPATSPPTVVVNWIAALRR